MVDVDCSERCERRSTPSRGQNDVQLVGPYPDGESRDRVVLVCKYSVELRGEHSENHGPDTPGWCCQPDCSVRILASAIEADSACCI
jgi:hypothetical protein